MGGQEPLCLAGGFEPALDLENGGAKLDHGSAAILAVLTCSGSVAKFRNSVVFPGLSRQASQVPKTKSGLKV